MPGDEIFFLSISELAKRIESKKLSPVELTELYLDRSQKFGPRFNAYATLTPEVALEQAKAAERDIQRGHYRGPLHGIPYAAKDLLAVKGVPTTWGAKPFVNQVFEYNATIIDHLKNVGAVMIGKAAMIELAGGMGYRFASASLQGEAKNPWDSACWTCGSSSGCGAIVAAGLAGFAIEQHGLTGRRQVRRVEHPADLLLARAVEHRRREVHPALQLVGDRRLRFGETMPFEPLRQIDICNSVFPQLLLQESACTRRPVGS